MSSLFAQYIREREGKNIIEDENGFATYKFEKDYVYVEDVYVCKNVRKIRFASGYLDKIAKEAKEKGMNRMVTSVCVVAKNPTLGMRAILGYGFKLLSSTNEMIYFVKDI